MAPLREPSHPLKLGMVGGGRDAFIGGVHRMAARLDGTFDLVAGALSSTPERARASGEALGLPRVYATWEAMLEAERALPEGERIDAVTIVTPNHVHFPVAHAFAEAGFHVICDKPLCLTSAEADDLVAVRDASGIVFAVTYNYTGYPMVVQARDMIAAGEIGTIRKVIVEYNQGWMATKVEATGLKQAGWRTDPSKAGAGALGDIGSHAENLVATVTGLELESICADVSSFVEGRVVDDDASALLRFRGGAKGVLIASQIAVGDENDLRIRVYGTEGSLRWRQERPNRLELRRLDGPVQILTRGGGSYLSPAAEAHARIPSGHPEGFLEAFGNIYANVAAAIHGHDAVYPDVAAGARGVRFIEATLASAASDAKWTPVS